MIKLVIVLACVVVSDAEPLVPVPKEIVVPYLTVEFAVSFVVQEISADSLVIEEFMILLIYGAVMSGGI